MKKLISIIIPAHNSEETIERCLLSVKKLNWNIGTNPNLFRDNFRATSFSAYSLRLRQKYKSDKTGKFRKTIHSKAQKCLGEIVHSSLSRKQKMSALLFVVSPMVWTKMEKVKPNSNRFCLTAILFPTFLDI